MSGGFVGSSQSSDASFSSVSFSKLCAMTSENPLTHSLPSLLSNTSFKSLVSATPSTLSFNSRNSGTASSARYLPTLSCPLRKKLLPASAGVVSEASRMVKWPIPGRTRFLRMEVLVAEAEVSRMRADSRAAWPEAAQSLQEWPRG